MYNGMLSILIPTYNRPEKLENTLKKIQKQKVSNYHISIVDNCSDYIVDDLVKKFPSEFQDKISVWRNEFNIGMGMNLIEIWRKCKTEWCWLLADDDDITDDAIEIILQKIEEHNDCSWIEFPVFYNKSDIISHDLEFNNLHEYLAFADEAYEKAVNFTGDLYFLSNKVFNYKKALNYLTCAAESNYAMIAQTVVLLKMLDGGEKGCLVNSNIVSHGNPCGASLSKFYSALRVFTDIPFDISETERKKLYKIALPCMNELLLQRLNSDFIKDDESLNKIYYEYQRLRISGSERVKIWLYIKVLTNKKLFQLYQIRRRRKR